MRKEVLHFYLLIFTVIFSSNVFADFANKSCDISVIPGDPINLKSWRPVQSFRNDRDNSKWAILTDENRDIPEEQKNQIYLFNLETHKNIKIQTKLRTPMGFYEIRIFENNKKLYIFATDTDFNIFTRTENRTTEIIEFNLNKLTYKSLRTFKTFDIDQYKDKKEIYGVYNGYIFYSYNLGGRFIFVEDLNTGKLLKKLDFDRSNHDQVTGLNNPFEYHAPLREIYPSPKGFIYRHFRGRYSQKIKYAGISFDKLLKSIQQNEEVVLEELDPKEILGSFNSLPEEFLTTIYENTSPNKQRRLFIKDHYWGKIMSNQNLDVVGLTDSVSFLGRIVNNSTETYYLYDPRGHHLYKCIASESLPTP